MSPGGRARPAVHAPAGRPPDRRIARSDPGGADRQPPRRDLATRGRQRDRLLGIDVQDGSGHARLPYRLRPRYQRTAAPAGAAAPAVHRRGQQRQRDLHQFGRPRSRLRQQRLHPHAGLPAGGTARHPPRATAVRPSHRPVAGRKDQPRDLRRRRPADRSPAVHQVRTAALAVRRDQPRARRGRRAAGPGQRAERHHPHQDAPGAAQQGAGRAGARVGRDRRDDPDLPRGGAHRARTDRLHHHRGQRRVDAHARLAQPARSLGAQGRRHGHRPARGRLRCRCLARS